MGTQFLDLPIEITLQILLSLDIHDLLTFASLNRFLHALTTSDIRIRHRLECFAANVVDNPNLQRPAHERVALLKRREDAWRTLTIQRRISVPIEHNSTGIYDLTGGVYFVGERLNSGHFSALTRKLRWIRLPSAKDDVDAEIQWNTIDVDKPISDLGLALDEHDLVAVAYFQIYHVQGDTMTTSLSLHVRLIQLSTGREHPLASQPTLFVYRYSIIVAPPALSIEIVGDKLVLLLSFPFAPRTIDEQVRLFVWNWKTGKLHYKMSAPRVTYQSFFFLTPDTIVIPNLVDPALEIFDISFTGEPEEDVNAPRCIRSLLLPPLADNASLIRLACRGEPNPMSFESVSNFHEPFLHVAENALVVFNIIIENTSRGRFGRIINLTLIVHRDAIAEWIQGKTNSKRVPYDKWGPSISRWFVADDSSTRWITTTCGQRFVSIPRQDGGRIILRDFNKFAVRKILALAPEEATSPKALKIIFERLLAREYAALAMAQNEDGEVPNEEDEDEDLAAFGFGDRRNENSITLSSGSPSPLILGTNVHLESGKIVRVVTRSSILFMVSGAFHQDVQSSLPYVETVSSESFDYSAVLMDEKRIIGLKLDENEERTVAIDILNFD